MTLFLSEESFKGIGVEKLNVFKDFVLTLLTSTCVSLLKK